MTRRTARRRDPRGDQAQQATTCVLYLRESFHRTGREKFSLAAQEEAALEYAAAKRLQVLRIFRETASGWKSGRPGFTEMLGFLRRQQPRPAVVMTHVDRGARNHEDYAALRKLGVERHYASEGQVVTAGAEDTGGRLIEVIRAEMAEQDSEKISRRVKASMRRKAQQGSWPSAAPIGYVNVASDGRKLIEPHPTQGPVVTKLFARYARGNVGLHALEEWAWRRGLRTRRSGRVKFTTLATLLRSRVYLGMVEWDDVLVEGDHEPLVTLAVWDQVQAVLERRRTNARRPKRLEFLFGGLVRCACGRMLSGDRKTKKNGAAYTYYKCSRQNEERCGARPASEPRLRAGVVAHLTRLAQHPEALRWMQGAFLRSMRARSSERERELAHLRERHDAISRRIDAAYEDHLRRLEGSSAPGVMADVFDRKLREGADEQGRLRDQMEASGRDDTDVAARAAKIFELAARAPQLWKDARSVSRRRELLELVASNCVWDGTALSLEYAQPFDALALLSNEGAEAGPALGGLVDGDSELVSRQGIEPRTRRLRVCD